MNTLKGLILWMILIFNSQILMASDDEVEGIKWQYASHNVTVKGVRQISSFDELPSLFPYLFSDVVDQPLHNQKVAVYLDGDETVYRTLWTHADKNLEWIGCPDLARTYFTLYAEVLNKVFSERRDLFPEYSHADFLNAKTCEKILHDMDPSKINASIDYAILDPCISPVISTLNIPPKHITLVSGQQRNNKKKAVLDSLKIEQYRLASVSDKAFNIADDVKVMLDDLRYQPHYDPNHPLTILLVDNSRNHVLNGFYKNIEHMCNMLIPSDLHRGEIHIYPLEFTYFETLLHENRLALKDEFIFYFETVMQKK